MARSVLWGAEVDYGARGTGKTNYNSGGTIAGSALDIWETNFGKKQSLVHIGTRWMSSGSYNTFSTISGALDILHNAGRLAFCEWLPWDSPGHAKDWSLRLTEITAGTHDAYITAWATACAAWGKPLILRPFVEQNIGSLSQQYPWQYGSGAGTLTITNWTYALKTITNVVGATNPTITATGHGYVAGQPIFIAGVGGITGVNGARTVLAVTNANAFTITATTTGSYTSGGTSSQTWTNTYLQFIAAWQHLVTVFRASCPSAKVQFVWCPNIQGTTAGLTMAQQYPGDAYVDILGWDGYTSTTDSFWKDHADIFHGAVNLMDMYGDMVALDGTGQKPFMVCETGFWGTVGSPVAVSSIVTNGTTWTVTTASPMPSESVAGAAFDITGFTPAGYNGEWNIQSVTSSTIFVIANTATPGAVTVAGTAQCIDRVNRAINYTKSLEIDLPASPRIEYISFFHTAYNPSQWAPDYDGTQPLNVDAVAFRKAIGGCYYLAGGLIGTDTAGLNILPFKDQPLQASGALERYRAVSRSGAGLECALLLKDTIGTTTVVDDSVNGRTGTVNGTAALGAANVIPAEPSWTAATFPGSVGNNISIPHNVLFSPVKAVAANSQLTVEATFLLTTTPGGTCAIVSKAAASNYEWSMFVNATTVGFSLFQLNGTNYSFNSFNLPTLNVPHHFIACIDVTNAAVPVVMYLDGVPRNGTAASGSMGIPSAGAAVLIGQRGDGIQPLPAGSRVGGVMLYSTCLTPASVAAKFAAWQGAPVLSAVTLGLPTGNTAAVGWTTDVGASSSLEYGPTTSYGSTIAYDPRRLTSHAVGLAGLVPAGLYHYRIRSRNDAGTEVIGPDQVLLVPPARGGLLSGG